MNNIDFYDELDNMFDKLYNTYGLNKDLIDTKKYIIDKFEKINENRENNSNTLLKKITKKQFIIDNDGIIKSCK